MPPHWCMMQSRCSCMESGTRKYGAREKRGCIAKTHDKRKDRRYRDKRRDTKQHDGIIIPTITCESPIKYSCTVSPHYQFCLSTHVAQISHLTISSATIQGSGAADSGAQGERLWQVLSSLCGRPCTAAPSEGQPGPVITTLAAPHTMQPS